MQKVENCSAQLTYQATNTDPPVSAAKTVICSNSHARNIPNYFVYKKKGVAGKMLSDVQEAQKALKTKKDQSSATNTMKFYIIVTGPDEQA